MYRRSPPLFQPSFRIMLNNGTNAIVSAERDHVQITMIRRYHREPPTRTPCSLVSAPICMNSCFRALSFLLFTVVNNSIPPPLSLFFFFFYSNLVKDYLFIRCIYTSKLRTHRIILTIVSLWKCVKFHFFYFLLNTMRERSRRDASRNEEINKENPSRNPS